MELYNQEIKNYSPSKVENSMKPKFARTTQVTHIIQTSTQETIILQLTQTLSFFLSKYHILNKPNKKSLLHNNSFR